MGLKWGLFGIAVSIIAIMVCAGIGILVTDVILALLSGSLVAVAFTIYVAARGTDHTAACVALFLPLVGALVAFAIGWAILAGTVGGLLGSTAMAFDLLIGVLGAATVFPLLKPTRMVER